VASPPPRNWPITYFKRFRMEADQLPAEPPPLPEDYSWVPWSEGLLEAHADALHASFAGEVDAVVFPSLGDPGGCRTLMSCIVRRSNFLPGATWLLSFRGVACGTVQAVRERGVGAIQNLGVAADFRGRGLGFLLLSQTLFGFRQAGLARAILEVTSQNERALRLYRRLGFRRTRTLYKAVQAGLV
jgi:ribosomal protein S18 acetylase RimI-like enzyme